MVFEIEECDLVWKKVRVETCFDSSFILRDRLQRIFKKIREKPRGNQLKPPTRNVMISLPGMEMESLENRKFFLLSLYLIANPEWDSKTICGAFILMRKERLGNHLSDMELIKRWKFNLLDIQFGWIYNLYSKNGIYICFLRNWA